MSIIIRSEELVLILFPLYRIASILSMASGASCFYRPLRPPDHHYLPLYYVYDRPKSFLLLNNHTTTIEEFPVNQPTNQKSTTSSKTAVHASYPVFQIDQASSGEGSAYTLLCTHFFSTHFLCTTSGCVAMDIPGVFRDMLPPYCFAGEGLLTTTFLLLLLSSSFGI
jgi:hypothetical protein